MRACLDSFFITKNNSFLWQIIIADDGSTDGTKEYLKELQKKHKLIIVENNRRGIHHQVNSILKYLSSIDFDLCFKIDDDILFQKEGWDKLYWNTIERTGYDHLIFYDKNWRPHLNLERPIISGNLVANCFSEGIQGAFYTLTPSIIQAVGYFDEQRFGSRGLGHIDFSFRCCRAGFNVLKNPFDVKSSNNFIQLQSSDTMTNSISSKYKSLLNPKEIIELKKDVFRSHRVYIPYNENKVIQNSSKLDWKISKTSESNFPKKPIFQKADAAFYPERGISGFIGFLLKRFYNFSIDNNLFFIPKLIKGFGRLLNKISIDLINIED